MFPARYVAGKNRKKYKREDPKQYLKPVKIRKITYRVVSNEKDFFLFKIQDYSHSTSCDSLTVQIRAMKNAMPLHFVITQNEMLSSLHNYPSVY